MSGLLFDTRLESTFLMEDRGNNILYFFTIYNMSNNYGSIDDTATDEGDGEKVKSCGEVSFLCDLLFA